jgi:hypothetical protein
MILEDLGSEGRAPMKKRTSSLSVFVLISLYCLVGNAQQGSGETQSPKGAAATSSTKVELTTAQELPAQALVQSFMEWKSSRVHEAQQKLEQMTKSGGATNVWQEGRTAQDAAIDETQNPTEQKLNFNIDVALQLNIHDYFSMYLKTLSPEEFKAATKKLSDEEKAELLLAYKNASEKEKKIPLKLSKIPKDNAKSKNLEIQ